jgi:ankyrin repeat protein
MVNFLPPFDKEAALERIFTKLHGTADFEEVDFSDINACSLDGDNALHCVVGWGDIDAAKALINAGIDINKAGDLGYTPLHVACMKGNLEMVKLLVESGAELFAVSEGDGPFATARLRGHDAICEFLAPLMHHAQEQDPNIWVRTRITQLRREIARLEAHLKHTSSS